MGFMVVNLDELSSVEQVVWQATTNQEQLSLGQGKKGNIKINFINEQTYLGTFGQFPEQVKSSVLQVNDPEILLTSLAQ